MELPLYKRLLALPMTVTHIVVPAGYELEIRREAIVDRTSWCAGEMKDVLFGRRIVWVETLGL